MCCAYMLVVPGGDDQAVLQNHIPTVCFIYPINFSMHFSVLCLNNQYLEDRYVPKHLFYPFKFHSRTYKPFLQSILSSPPYSLL